MPPLNSAARRRTNATASIKRHRAYGHQRTKRSSALCECRSTIGNDPMTILYTQQNTQHQNGTVIALHCSLGSGRQWTKLISALGASCGVIAPAVEGYGRGRARPTPPLTLAEEVEQLGTAIGSTEG